MFHASKKDSSTTLATPFLLMGTRTFHRTRTMLAPSSWAASRISSGTERKHWVMRKVPKPSMGISTSLLSFRYSMVSSLMVTFRMQCYGVC